MKRFFFNRGFSPSSVRSIDRPAFVMVVILLLGAFAIAGGARDDLASLLIWRPLSAFLLVLAVIHYGVGAWRNGRHLLLFALATIGLVALHLVPLPPAFWSSLPGRGLIVDVYQAAGMALPWQPLSMVQARTWNALFSLAAPLALLIALLVLDHDRHRQLLLLILSVGFVSGIIGMVQAVGPSNGPLYFYRVTNNGIAVGLFANRNHQAAMLATLFPLLAAHLSLFKGRPDKLFFRRSMTLAAAALLVPLILMTGSRAGLILTAIGVAFAWWVYRPPVAKGRVVGIAMGHRSRLIGIGIALCMLVVVVIVLASTPALHRLLETDPVSELRLRALPTVFEASRQFFPIGSGVGTFVEAYQIFEPVALLSDNYLNHAHNDFAEILMTGGLPAVGLLLWAIFLMGRSFLSLMSGRRAVPEHGGFSRQILGRAGFAVLAMLALASATDYPLRTPSLMLYAVLAAVWCFNAYKSSESDKEHA